MICYISICGHPENGLISSELELCSALESSKIDFGDKETIMTLIPEDLFDEYFFLKDEPVEIEEGDIFVVEQEKGVVHRIIFKDNFEKARRIKILEELM
jgi:hypothetical protein